MSDTPLRGVLHFFSETGTEGGHWAFQDERFMHLPPPNQWWCSHCGRVWDKDQHPDEEPKPGFTYLRPQVRWHIAEQHLNTGEWVDDNAVELPDISQLPEGKITWAYRSYDQPMDFPLQPTAGDDVDGAWNKIHNQKSRQCYEQGHLSWQSPREQWPTGTWSYEGLHVLGDGDELTIFGKADPSMVVWSGIITLKRHDLFTEDARGMWIHADQSGIDRETWAAWFFAENPAELRKAEQR